MLTQISHIVMAVADLGRCRTFYGQTLELPQIGQGVNATGQAVCLFQVGPSVLELQEDPVAPLFGQTESALRPEINHFALYVDDLDATYDTLKDRDIEFDGVPHTTELGHRNMQRALVTCTDPNGFHIQLAQVVDPRPHLEGRRAAKKRMAAALQADAVLFGGIDHIATYCTDFSATRAFYKDILGLEEFFHSTTREEGVEVAAGFEQGAFAIGGTDIELATDETWQELGPGEIRQLSFATDDIDQAYEVVESRGGKPEGPAADWSPLADVHRRAFMLRGPDGLVVQIIQRL